MIDKRRIQYAAAAFLLLAVLFLAVACSSGSTETPADTPGGTVSPRAGGRFTPYATATGTVTPTPPDPSTPTPLPSPTATPQTHEVKQGEDMFGIALRYRISLDELRTANPTVNPNLLSIGTLLVIPESLTPMPSTEQPSPTPIPVSFGLIHCVRTADGGAWCFQPVQNTQEYALESLGAVFRLTDAAAQHIVAQQAYLPLDVLPAGAILPFYAYYPPEMITALSGPLVGSSELQGTLPYRDDGRYLPVELANQKVTLRADGLSAQITLDAALAESIDATATRLWIAAVAYDQQGRVTGVRRWEMPSDTVLESEKSLPVTFDLYSAAGSIERIELLAEARP